MTTKRGLKRVGYCQWALEGPVRTVIIRRNGRRYQVFYQGYMIAGFFNTDYPRKSDAVAYAKWVAGWHAFDASRPMLQGRSRG